MCETLEEFKEKYSIDIGDTITYTGKEIEVAGERTYTSGQKLEVFEIRVYNNTLVVGENLGFPAIVDFEDVQEISS